MVVLWLSKIHRELPVAVRHHFATQLRENTLYSIRVEISDAIPVLLNEITERESNINRAGGYSNQSGRFNSQAGRYNGQSGRYSNQAGRFNNQAGRSNNQSQFNRKKCCLCEAAGRSSEGHFLSACPFLPTADKNYMAKAREVLTYEGDDEDFQASEEEFQQTNLASRTKRMSIDIRRVDIVPSPILSVSVNSHTSDWTLDCGAESNLIEEAECKKCNVKIVATNQTATMADGRSSLEIVGETHFTATHGHHTFEFSALVVKKLDTPVLAGMPFLKLNDVFVRPKSNTIYLGDCCTVNYPTAKVHGNVKRSNARLCTTSILRVPQKTCLLPGEKISLPLPEDLKSAEAVTLEPRCTSPKESSASWLNCEIVVPDEGNVCIRNSSSEPVLLEKHSQFCQVRPTIDLEDYKLENPSSSYKPDIKKTPVSGELYSSSIQLDPSNQLSAEQKMKFLAIHKKYDSTFSPSVGCYNGKSGKFKHKINMGLSLPPQRRGRVPQYRKSDLVTLQRKFDELLNEGVFARPEDENVSVEYIHPSFLVKKKSGGFRLVTNFGQMGEYCKPTPCKLSTVEDVLKTMGQWRYIIKADCKWSYFQCQLDRDSMKYVGVSTPYKGTLIYTRSVMGLPVSEAALEEVLSRVLGDLMADGGCVKLSDDLYFGSDSVDTLADIWESALSRLSANGLKLAPGKTEICPASTVILGWLWENGYIRSTPHRLNALAECEPPETVTGLRSFIGAYNFISRVLPFYADKLDPLEQVITSCKSGKVEWTSDLLECFNKAKAHLKEAKTVVLPTPDDQLYIVTDAALRCAGIASALYVVRNGQRKLAGYFNAKRRGHQASWLPCEVEALSIGCSINHFQAYIIQSNHVTKVLTDSKPCVHAFQKLCRGQFSVSPRVTTYLSIASRYRVQIEHIAGSTNVFSDFLSRNPVECSGCQVCEFVHAVEDAVVKGVSVKDILSGQSRVPFTSRSSWLQIQQSCPDLVQVQKYKIDGLQPPKTKKNITDIRRYMNSVKLSTVPNDGLLIVASNEPFKQSTQRIVIPRGIVEGLLMALHLELEHPTKHQLRQVFTKGFFALDLDKLIPKVNDGCYVCSSLEKCPSIFHQQSTSEPPDKIGCHFSTDVLRRYNQFIMLFRESISSYTEAVIIPDEKTESLRDGIIRLSCRMRSALSPPAVVRSDGCTGLQSLVNDETLLSHQLRVEIGDLKNVNKNPISEKAIEELHAELVRVQPRGGKVSDATLAIAVSNLNSRIRHGDLSATEIWTQREMTSGKQLSLNDEALIRDKLAVRIKGHHPSAKYKSRGKEAVTYPNISLGEVVFLYSDRSKLKEREKYLVTSIEKDHVWVQKLTNNQLRAKSYHVKKSDIITVSSYPTTLPVPVEEKAPDEYLHVPLYQDNTQLQAPEVVDRIQEVIRDAAPTVDGEQEVFEDEPPDVNDRTFIPPVHVPVEETAASHRPRRQNSGRPPSRYGHN